jgi:hypothetical protein
VEAVEVVPENSFFCVDFPHLHSENQFCKTEPPHRVEVHRGSTHSTSKSAFTMKNINKSSLPKRIARRKIFFLPRFAANCAEKRGKV